MAEAAHNGLGQEGKPQISDIGTCTYKGMHVRKIQENAKRQDISVMMRCIDKFYRLLLGSHRSQLPLKSHIYEWP